MSDERLRNKLINTDEFVLTFELVPGKTRKGKRVQKIMEFARQAAQDGKLDALSLTDNPGGNPLLSPDNLGREIIKLGMDSIVHMTCRDSNRLGLYSRAQQLESIGVRNLLVLTGDYPTEDDHGSAKPCFDLCSVSLLCFLSQMNGQCFPPCMNVRTDTQEKTDFFLGTAISCFKYTESEQWAQYYKLVKKVRNGAQYAITQVGYDARKLHELVQFAANADITVPLIGTVYILSKPSARFMNSGQVPGVYVEDSLYKTIAEEAKAPDKGKAASLERSAKLMAILKGLGFRGAHISGNASYDDIRELLKIFDRIKDDWRDFVDEFKSDRKDGFYIFRKSDGTGLNIHEASSLSSRALSSWLAYQLYEGFHKTAFNERHLFFPLLKSIAAAADSHRWTRTLFREFEHLPKKLMFDCRMCGDCALSSMGYICPESKCPKTLRNGPCGGSRDKACEVFPDRQCAWVRVYRRLKAVNRAEALKQACSPPRNWALDKTSSWLNFYMGRDHHHVGTPDRCAQSDKTKPCP